MTRGRRFPRLGPFEKPDLEWLGRGLCGRYAASMFVAITCPTCQHCGYIPKDMLPRRLSCSHCGSRARFESAAKLLTKEEARRFALNIAKLPGLLRKP